MGSGLNQLGIPTFPAFVLFMHMLSCSSSGFDHQLEDSFIPIQSIFIPVQSKLIPLEAKFGFAL